MTTAAIIVAAGRGTRAGGDVPKQWQTLRGQTVVEHTLDVFESHTRIDEIVLVVSADDMDHVDRLALTDRATITRGGAERSSSVRNGLQSTTADHVLIHDAARCCLPPEVIDRVLDALEGSAAAAPALPVSDALWTGRNNRVTGIHDRSGLFRAQTPQGFHGPTILAAHDIHGAGAADDVEVARRAGMDVTIVLGDERNLKITTPADFVRAATLLEPLHDPNP